MELASWIGGLATIASVTSFAPQAWKIIRTRDTRSLSTAMYAITVSGFALWLAYGLMLKQWPLIAANGLCLALSSFILMMKLLPLAQREAVADKMDPTEP